MNKAVKSYLENIYKSSAHLNHRNIFSLTEKNEEARLLDLGCDDGEITNLLAHHIGTSKVFGVEIVEDRIRLAAQNGVTVKKFDLNDTFVFEDGFFDVVHANQVIEHIQNGDNFISEIYRILKPGGYAIISTENASSWCNIFASTMGWQIFSLTNISSKKPSIGNPFALHREGVSNMASWNHTRIYNISGLKEHLEIFGFAVEAIRGSGYFPLPSVLGDLDKTHSHFMTFKIRKPEAI